MLLPTRSKDEIQAEADVDVQPEAEAVAVPSFGITVQAEGSPKVSGVAYTGGKLRLPNYPSPVVIDLAGLRIPKTVPLLVNHENKTFARLGLVAATVHDGALYIEGDIVSTSGTARGVIDQGKAGNDWQLSVGAQPDTDTVELVRGERVINGQRHVGPFYHVKGATLREVSVLPIGADEGAHMRIAAAYEADFTRKESEMKYEEWLTAKGFDPAALDEKQNATLKASYDAEINPPAPATPPKKAESTPLDEIVAAQRIEQDRHRNIEAIAASAITDHPESLDTIDKMAKAAIEAKSDTKDFELALLRGLRPTVRSRRPKQDDVAPDVLEAALCTSTGLYMSGDRKPEDDFKVEVLEAAHKQWPHGLGIQELLLRAAHQRGYESYSVSNVKGLLQAAFDDHPQGIQAAGGFSTVSLSGILGNTANKFLSKGFMSVENTWRKVCSIGNVRDFKAMTHYVLTGATTYQEVGPDGEIQHALPGETSYTNQAKTYGLMLAITRHDIINDDLGALSKNPTMLGRGAALKLNLVFWTAFMAAESTFWTVAQGNRNASSETVDNTGLTAAELLFMNQTDPDGHPLGVAPAILLVPPALKRASLAMMNSLEIREDPSNAGTDDYPTGNTFSGNYEVAVSAYLSNSSITNYSAAEWYLMADPNDLSAVEVVFLNGKDMPTVETADADFNQLGIQMRAYHDFGVTTQEYRASVKMAVD